MIPPSGGSYEGIQLVLPDTMRQLQLLQQPDSTRGQNRQGPNAVLKHQDLQGLVQQLQLLVAGQQQEHIASRGLQVQLPRDPFDTGCLVSPSNPGLPNPAPAVTRVEVAGLLPMLQDGATCSPASPSWLTTTRAPAECVLLQTGSSSSDWQMSSAESGSQLWTGDASSPPAEDAHVSTSLYVRNLAPDADELLLYRTFAPYGALQSCKVMTDGAGRCRGVGFVNYMDQACALLALQKLQGKRVSEGRQLHLTLQAPRAVRAAMHAAVAMSDRYPPTSFMM